MKELIPLNQNNSNAPVSAKDLYDFLEIKTAFSNWIKRMLEYGFEEDKDFTPFLAESSGGRPLTDYALTLDCAKEISMIQRSEKGKQARQYFLECEKLAKSLVQPQSEDLVLANAFQILNNRVLAQQKEIAKMTPKADYVDKITSSSSYFTTTHVGAPFGLSAIALHKFLIDRGVIRRMSDGEHVMLSKYMNKGYEYYKPVVIHAKDMTKRQLCWTELGRAFIHNLIDPFKRVQSVNNQIQNGHA